MRNSNMIQEQCCWVNINTIVNKANSSPALMVAWGTWLNEDTNMFVIAHNRIKPKRSTQHCETM